MKAFQLIEKKEFMHLLLRTGLFDNFLLAEAAIRTSINYEIDGHLNKGFFTEEELEQNHLEGLDYMPYGQVRPFCYELIKGRRTPSYFKFVLMLSPANLSNTVKASGTPVSPADISAAFFNILFQNNQLMLTTGISYRTFVLDNSFEKEWEKFTIQFLKKNSIIFSEI